MKYREYIGKLINKTLNVDIDKLMTLFTIPPNDEMGDLAFPCFSFAKDLRKAPPLIAKDILDNIEKDSEFDSLMDRVEVAGGYLNFFFNRETYVKEVLFNILEKGEAFAKTDQGQGKRVLVEFSSPNIAKPFHIGHLFTTALGSSIEKIYSYLGYETVKINHLGDWGTQFGKLISAYKRWGDASVIEKDPINELLKIYVKFHEEAQNNPSLEDEARNYFRLLEEGDKEVKELWDFFVKVSMKEFKRVYEMLDISFDSYAGESFYQDKMPAVIKELEDKNLLVEDDGAKLVVFDDMPPCILIKKDGTSIYATRDLTAAIYRKNHYDFYKNIYVVGLPQKLHFNQVFGIIEKMGYDWASENIHVAFGTVKFPDKKLSTRQGDVVFLEDVLNESIQKTREVILSSPTTKEIDDIDSVAKKIGIGAVLFTFLKNQRERDIVFTWEDILDFEGESGPYVQYSYARGMSILRRLDLDCSNGDLSLLVRPDEYSLVKHLNAFKGAIVEAASKYEPSILTRHLVDTAQAFNKFYNNYNILRSEEDIKLARLNLVKATCIALKTGLNLLGIEVVDKM